MSKKKGFAIIAFIVAATIFVGVMDIFGLGSSKTGSAKEIKLGLDLAGGVSITYQAVGEEAPSGQDMDDTVSKLKKRVEGYSTEAVVYREGADRINVEIPGATDPNQILKDLGKPGSLYFIKHYGSDGTANYVQVGYKEDGSLDYDLTKSIEELEADGSIVCTGSDVKSAQAGSQKDNMNNVEYVVHIVFNEEGTKKFAEATTAAVATHDTIMIYYDGDDASVPAVNAAITDGSAIISGSMKDFEEAERLASTIRIGGLKVELAELRSNVVGASLGQEAISTSLLAGLVGFIVVVILMVAVYYVCGVTSALALALYVALEIMLINGFGITLTLPGIAGIILSIGMAVDANVIIFARIREELQSGKTVESSIKVAYSKAMSAILDGNITTLIAAFVLWIMGSGSIKGFAQTLTLGICLSMFTAVVITKYLLRAFVAIGVSNTKLYGVAKTRKPIDFIGKKHIYMGISGALIALGIVMMLFVNKGVAGRGNSLNFSLDFLGGTQTTVNFGKVASLENINDMQELTNYMNDKFGVDMVSDIEKIVGDPNVIVTKVQGNNEVIFKTVTLSAELREAMDKYLEDTFGVDVESIRAESISSTISKEAQRETIIALIVACVCMLIYIWFRFKDIRFGASSVIALAHDVLVTLTFYSLAYISVGSTFVACMLTIVGYSINATIVVFDRIREKLHEEGSRPNLKEIVNSAVTQTLSRSIFTSLTTFVMVVALYIFGVSSVKEFALPLSVGILCGTYSSVCLAGSLWYMLRTGFKKKQQ
ncbi:MAG: protein translocase subunit SecD [Lachnospiraceae bacterium]|nr:protein translocase subunit SecD [Lachnospiraceae bacterium]